MNSKSNLAATFFIILTIVFDVSAATLPRKLLGLETSEISSARALAESPSGSPVPAPAPSDGFFDEKKCFGRCQDRRSLTACLQLSPTAPEEASIFVKNDGQSNLKVNVTVSHPKNTFSDIEIPKQGTKKINIPASVGERPSIVLNAGYGECVILVGESLSNDNILKQLSLYAARATPVHGAYLSVLTVLIIGVTWACCKSRKSGRQQQGDGVPYQDLEMAKPDSLAADNVKTMELWDQDWGDDDKWDEMRAGESPSSDKLENGSVNGLTSRSSDRDGWELSGMT